LQHWADVRFYTSLSHLAESYVFDKQSLPPTLLFILRPPYPEVTGLICRVPLTSLALTPYLTQAIYMCLC